MSGVRRGLMLVAVVVAAMMVGWVSMAGAQVATTTVQDTVYSASGTPASGTVLVSWGAFTTAGGQSVPAGSTSATIGANGQLSIALAPNAGAMPMGSYYTAVLHLSDGTTSRQYWVVPVTVPGAGPATLSQIKNEVLPLSVAMQTVSKQYVDQAIAAVQTGAPLATSVYVPVAGGLMSGPLVLPADPVSANQAATKNYVDTNIAATAAGITQKLSSVPLASQAVAQPSGTNFSISGAYTNTTFADLGKSTQMTVTPTTLAANPSAAGVVLSQNQLTCSQPGFDLGNNGTSAQGWSTCILESNVENSSSRGIDQLIAGRFSHNGQGDTAANYVYLTSFGGKVATSDEGVEHTVLQNHQIGFMKGTLSNGFAGSTHIYAPLSAGYTVLSPFDVIPASGNLGTITLNFSAMPTAQTDDVVIATNNGNNSYTITNIIPVSVAATLGSQTLVSGTGFAPTTVVSGQVVGLYVPSGSGPAGDSIQQVAIAGAPSLGTATYSTAGIAGGEGLSISTTMGVPTTGASNIVATGMSCNGYCQATAGQTFADGGILLDMSRGGAAATLGGYGRAMNGMYYTLASGSVAVSTAWGNISSCTNNGNGQGQAYVSTTCQVTLGTSPASPGNFVAGKDIFLSGPFEEEAAVTAVGTPSAGVQSVTFNTRYAWNNGGAALVMQGGPGGQSFVATTTASSWPVAYAVVGATSPTQVFFSNCVVGGCNGSGSTGNALGAGVASYSGFLGYGSSLIRNNGVVTMAAMGTGVFSYPAGSTITLTGAVPADLNGTFTVASNSEDGEAGNAAYITWVQTGVNETATNLGTMTGQAPSITFYPSAFITGTNGGVQGSAQLATNTVPFVLGDTVVGAPSSEFNSRSVRIVQGQETPVDGSQPSGSISINDDGPSQMAYVIQAQNNPGNGVAGPVISAEGSYGVDFYLGYRPANNGSIIFVQGGEPVSSNPKPYYIFADGGSSFGKFMFNPNGGTFLLGGALTVPGVTAINTASAFASGTTIGGVLPCLQNGTNCPAMSGGGSGSVTGVAMGTWPSWLTPTVSNATSTPTVSVTANAIPNTALANSATTVNGQTCALGSSCTLPTGFAQVTGVATAAQLPAASSSVQGAVILPASATTNSLGAAAMLPGSVAVNGQTCALGGSCTVTGTPPAEIKYYPAAVCDGGTAYASAMTRYDNQQPQAGCVLPASSSLGYLAFNAAATAPQYAETTLATPPYWTGTNLYLKFYSQATTGSVTWYVQAACTNDGSVIGAPTFGTAVAVTQAVSATAGGGVTSAVVPGIAVPGSNGCVGGTTVPGSLLTFRVFRSSTDSATGNANLLGVTLVTGRSQ